jgi:glycosyltransferase 2 family protein
VFVSGFLGFFMPGAVGVELVRVYVLARLTHVTLAFSSVLVERLTALLALVGIVLLGLLVAPVGLPDAIGTYAVPTAALLCLAVLSLLANRVRALYLALLTGPMLAPLRSRLVAFYRQIDAFRQTPSLMTQLAALSIGLQLLRVLEGVALAVALGVDVELAYLFVIIPAGLLVTMLPISLGGLGVREALYVALFGAIGIDAASAFTLPFVNFLLGVMVLLLPGAILYAFGGLTLKPADPIRLTISCVIGMEIARFPVPPPARENTPMSRIDRDRRFWQASLGRAECGSDPTREIGEVRIMPASDHVWHRGNRGDAVPQPPAREEQVVSAAVGVGLPCSPLAANARHDRRYAYAGPIE